MKGEGLGRDVKMKKIGTVALLAVLSLAACAVKTPMTPSRPTVTEVHHASNSAAATQQLADAMKLVADEIWPQAAVALHTIIEARAFRSFPEDVQYRTLRTAEQVAVEHGTVKGHYDYFVRTTALPQAGIRDWQDRLAAADRLGDKAEVANCLTVLVQRWPDQAIKFDPDRILRTVRDAETVSHGATLPLLQALYDAHWRLKGDIEPSGAWRDLTLQLLDRGRFAEAIEVSGHVTDVYDLIAMRADLRFDALVAANPAHFDIEAAADREFQTLQAASEGTPDSLALKSDVIEALLSRQHYEAALAAADADLLDIRSTNFPSKVYTDYDEAGAWFFNLRSIALERVGRWDDGLAQLEAASLLHKNHEATVNQLVDLGYRYCVLGRPKDALTTLGTVNQLDQAAAQLIARLADEDLRQDALLSVQEFSTSPGTPRMMSMDAQWRAIIARRDVQTAIHRVGRVESYRLEESLFGN
jgi:tetratricopeptide (TPR) repeat protein